MFCRPFDEVISVLFVQRRERIPFAAGFESSPSIRVDDDITSRRKQLGSSRIAGLIVRSEVNDGRKSFVAFRPKDVDLEFDAVTHSGILIQLREHFILLCRDLSGRRWLRYS